MADMDGSLLGLGFTHHAMSAPSSSVEGMMQQYVNQCTDYDGDQHRLQVPHASSFHFVPAREDEPHRSSNMNYDTYAPIPGPPSTVAQELVLARSRALEVVKRFQQGPSQGNDITDSSNDSTNDNPETNTNNYHCNPNSECSRKRKDCLEQFKERKRLILLKNLEYVARVQDERLREHLAQVQEAQEYERRFNSLHQRILQKRTEENAPNMLTQAGIGTQERQTVEHKRKQATAKKSDDSLAIYVCGLPTDGSVTQEVLQALFGNFGTLRKIHMYVDKQTGDLKGDALVIYQITNDQEKNELLESVCSQVRASTDRCVSACTILCASERVDVDYLCPYPWRFHRLKKIPKDDCRLG
jgi:hypothetical protein